MNVIGPHVRVRPTTHEDLPFLQSLWNDAAVMRKSGYTDGMHATPESMERWWRMTPNAQPSAGTYPHNIIELLDGTPIGEFIYSLDAHQRAFIDLKIISPHCGHGYGTEALTLTMRELFATTPITRVMMEPAPTNEAGHHLLCHCGFAPAPTENHPNRWECTRESFADREGQSAA
ncbi:MAG: GNAT family N-acetyltransferase [Armatimonadota bacterium]